MNDPTNLEARGHVLQEKKKSFEICLWMATGYKLHYSRGEENRKIYHLRSLAFMPFKDGRKSYFVYLAFLYIVKSQRRKRLLTSSPKKNRKIIKFRWEINYSIFWNFIFHSVVYSLFRIKNYSIKSLNDMRKFFFAVHFMSNGKYSKINYNIV